MPRTDDFDTFYRGSRQRLLSVVYLLTADSGEAQDAVQEAFVRAWQRWETIRGYENPEAWVRMVACRIATSRWRSMRSRLQAYRRHGVPPPVAPPGTATLEVVEAMRRLPEQQRIALALFYLVGMPITEVAEEMGTPVGTVKARLSRGRRTLAGLLAIQLEPMGDGRG